MAKMNYFIKEKVVLSIEADKKYKSIIEKDFENFDQYEEVSNITSLEVAKLVIKRLLEERYEMNN